MQENKSGCFFLNRVYIMAMCTLYVGKVTIRNILQHFLNNIPSYILSHTARLQQFIQIEACVSCTMSQGDHLS